MANFSLTNATIYTAGTDITGFSNKVTLKSSVQDLDVTPFGSSYIKRIGGLKSASLDVAGFTDYVQPDLGMFNNLGSVGVPITVSPAGTEGQPAYFMAAGRFSYTPLDAKVGDAAAFAFAAMNSDGTTGLIRGQLAKASGNVSGTGQLGSILTLAGPSATQFLYATFHVFTAGTTISVQIQSAPLIGFGAPTTQATIGPITTASGTFMTRVAGPITDGFWRLNVSAITGTFTVAGAIGVQ